MFGSLDACLRNHTLYGADQEASTVRKSDEFQFDNRSVDDDLSDFLEVHGNLPVNHRLHLSLAPVGTGRVAHDLTGGQKVVHRR